MEKLRNMTEKQRIQSYLSKYISYVEQKEYENAYNFLYDEFKYNYLVAITRSGGLI